MAPLRRLDEVAYLRFASVYRSFSSAEDFEREIEALRAHRIDAIEVRVFSGPGQSAGRRMELD